MGGSTKVIDTTPRSTQVVRDPLAYWLLRSGGGPQPQSYDPFSRIFTAMPGEMDRTMVQQVTGIGPLNRDAIRDVSAQQVGFSPTGMPTLDVSQIPRLPSGVQIPTVDWQGLPRVDVGPVGGGFTPQALPEVTRGQIRDVSAPGTASVDQLGGMQSEFFRNMLAQLQPAFAQRRAEALASAREAAGNLTGSGLANFLGSAVNRSLGEEQARLADYAVRGLGLEVERQQGDAARALQASLANQRADVGFLDTLLNRAIAQNQIGVAAGQLGLDAQRLGIMARQADQEAALRAMLANQAAGIRGQELGFQGQLAMQDAALRAMLANQAAGIRGQELGLQAGMSNQEAALRALLANQAMDRAMVESDLQRLLANQATAAQQAALQAQLDQQRRLAQFGTSADIARQNAANFLQVLLSMSSGGVAPATVVQSGGIGAILGPLLSGLGHGLGASLGG